MDDFFGEQESSMSEDSNSSAGTQSSSVGQTPTELYYRPYALIITNIPTPKCRTLSPLAEFLQVKLDMPVHHAYSVWHRCGLLQYGIIEFGSSAAEFKATMVLHRLFEKAKHGKGDWLKGGSKYSPYLWMATPTDTTWLDCYAADFELYEVPTLWQSQAVAAADSLEIDVVRRLWLFTSLQVI